MGMNMSILEAFVNIRKAKQRVVQQEARLREPTRKLLASNLLDLSERTEAIAKESEDGREALVRQVRSLQTRMEMQNTQLNAKLDRLLGQLQPLPLAPNGTANGRPAQERAQEERTQERRELEQDTAAHSQPLKAKAPSLRQKKKARAVGGGSPMPQSNAASGAGVMPPLNGGSTVVANGERCLPGGGPGDYAAAGVACSRGRRDPLSC